MDTPKILNDIVQYLKNISFKISENVEGEGRAGSLNDESSIKKLLFSCEEFKKYIYKVPPRRFGDILVEDPGSGQIYVVNIKTSLGGTDNVTSKLGFLYAFTDIKYEDLPSRIDWKTFDRLLKKHKADIPNKDYWFLCVNKNDTQDILIRGCKQINYYKENPTNFLQVDWKKEKTSPPANRTYEEAYDIIIMGIIRCYMKSFNNLPDDWKNYLK